MTSKLVQLENTLFQMHAHLEDECHGEICSIHHRTDHHMRSWPQFFRYDRFMMERTCIHGVGHPDPDDYRILHGLDDGIHGCDGCCEPPHQTNIEEEVML